MKTEDDFVLEEYEIMEEIAKLLESRGYGKNNLRCFDNWLGEPTVAMDIDDEDGNTNTYYLCFGVAEQAKIREETKNHEQN